MIQNGLISVRKRTLFNLLKRVAGRMEDQSPDTFNEFYYQMRTIARAVIFRQTEKLISSNSLGTDGGYRANLVVYAIAVICETCRRHKKSIDFLSIWKNQALTSTLDGTLAIAAKFVNDSILNPPDGISNVTEWCKKDACWTGVQSKIETLNGSFPAGFWGELVSFGEHNEKMKDAKKTQKIDNGIDAQKRSLEIGADQWAIIFQGLSEKGGLSPKEAGILKIAQQIPYKIPTEKQSMVLMGVLEKARDEGLDT